jgi:hypothetical protein
MENYFTLHGITDELTKIFIMEFSIWIWKYGNGGNGVTMHTKGMLLGHSLLQSYMNAMTQIPTI